MEANQISKELFMQLQDCETAEEIVKLLAANGFTVTKEEAEQILASFERELTDEEMARITGGGSRKDEFIDHFLHG